MTPVTPSRHRTSSDDVEQALLDAAAHLLTSEGPEALSVRRVATEAGVSPMGVYSRFGGKQGLVEALFRRGFDRLQEALESVGRDVEPMAAILEGCRQYRRFALDAPAVYSVMFSRVIPEFVPSDLCRRDAAGAFQVLVEGVRRGLASGALRPADAGDLAEGIWATCHGLVSLELAGMGFVPDRDAHFEATIAALLRGLGSTPDP